MEVEWSPPGAVGSFGTIWDHLKPFGSMLGKLGSGCQTRARSCRPVAKSSDQGEDVECPDRVKVCRPGVEVVNYKECV